MADHTSPDGPGSPDRSAGELTPDELEQRQRADGTYERDTSVDSGLGEPLDPDEVEQRQGADGTLGDPGLLDDPTDEPLDADEIDQRRVVEDDEDDAPSSDEG